MTSLKKYPHQTPESIGRLVAQCSALCKNIEGRLPSLPPEKGDFLVNNLGDALRQVELVLRVLEEESTSSSARKEDRKSFLTRLFAREEDGQAKPSPDEEWSLPDFSISRQGLQGNVATIPMAELLSFLAFSKKTGVLWVDGPTENFLLGMVEGKLIHANSDRTPEGLRLGEILVGLGCMTRRQLERFIAQIGNEQAVTGNKLVEDGMISRDELGSALLYQVQQLFSRLVKTKQAMFRFREGLEVKLEHQVDLDINGLLLNTARDLDEEDNKDQRLEARKAEWSSWQDDLSAKLVAVSPLVEEPDEESEAVETGAASAAKAKGAKP